jgi:hypothetical protein
MDRMCFSYSKFPGESYMFCGTIICIALFSSVQVVFHNEKQNLFFFYRTSSFFWIHLRSFLPK